MTIFWRFSEARSLWRMLMAISRKRGPGIWELFWRVCNWVMAYWMVGRVLSRRWFS